MRKILIIILSVTLLYGNCQTLEDYVSEFGFKSLVKWSSVDKKVKLSFKRILDKGECSTIVINKNKIIDKYSGKDVLEICQDFFGHFEMASIDKIVFSPSNNFLAILVVKEFMINFPHNKFSPYFGYHLYIYKVHNGALIKKSKYDKLGWGDGIRRGNQNENNLKLKCTKNMQFKYKNKKDILRYLLNL